MPNVTDVTGPNLKRIKIFERNEKWLTICKMLLQKHFSTIFIDAFCIISELFYLLLSWIFLKPP